ncbi:DUF202 domain-containing protein [Nocardioides daejeonensis]|uniref:DUF202 domain-containing protein n=1 Tax=Nocardioides daejeonensis TaxID=1046556 RepID=UPI000D742C9F|nr:DUF202 domain-containing protein [Nocardioides daejeonensis]
MVDPGISNERTALAWQRTALSLVAGAAVIARLAIDETGPSVLVPLVVAGLLGLWIFAESRARYRHSAGHLQRSGGRGGRAALSLASATALIAIAELMMILR